MMFTQVALAIISLYNSINMSFVKKNQNVINGWFASSKPTFMQDRES